MSCIIHNCTYVTNPGFDHLQQLALHMPTCSNAYPREDKGPKT